ncbi:GAF domain-like protein [Tricladium varicosporioides]|nr:GAF domain-like protein [Hymenoscyphus varicosporioides]
MIPLGETVEVFGPPQVSRDKPKQATTKSGNYFVTSRFSYFSGGEGKDPKGGKPRSNERQQDNMPRVKQVSGEQVFRCEDEPIHIPGAVQRFGALIAIRENENGLFLVRIVSENSRKITGLDPEALFELRCFTDILIQNDKREFTNRARGMKCWTREDDIRTNPDVFTISLTSLMGAPKPLFCAMHCNEGSDLIICEFEPKNDVFQSVALALPENPISVTDSQASAPEQIKPNMAKSKPLRINRESGRQLGSMELFHILCEMQTQLAGATSLSALLDITVGLVYELTGFHRVMVYQFDETKAGCVVAEYFNSKASRDSYLNLHFPASDIPKQARELYVINKIRVLYDRDEETARLMCRTMEDAETPLDMKHSYLRAMSPIHIKYLQNMGVQASMSISLMVDGKLWGLISCHNYGLGMRVSLPVRELCRSLGENCSTHIEKLLYQARIKVRKPLSAAPKKTSPTAFIAASSSDLLNMFDADFGFLAIKGEARTIGKLFVYNEAIALLQYIRQRSFVEIFATQNVKKDCPDILFEPGLQVLVGMLVVPLALSGADFLVFFRKTKEKEILWAGNPNEKSVRHGTIAYLEPRSSFRRWTEQVVGTSREWTEDQVESAAVLSTLYGRFIEVWRQKDSIVQRNRMTRLLIRNAGHEVRTPLNSIINYLEVALEEPLDERARQHLYRSLQASKALVFVVNDLLSLTEVEDVDFKVHEDNVNLKRMVVEIIEAFKGEARRRGMFINLEEDQDIPNIVRSDPAGLRQVLSNLLTNAIEHGLGKYIKVGLKHLGTTDQNSMIEISFKDEGKGLTEQELDCIFQDLEQVLDEDEGQPEAPEAEPKEPKPKSIGLGLAFTARFVRLNYGQISMSSEKNKGTRVSVKIPFRKALRVNTTKSPLELSLPTPPSDISNGNPLSAAFPAAQAQESRIPGAVEAALVSTTSSRAPASGVSTSMTLSGTPNTGLSLGRYPFPEIGARQLKFSVLIAEDNPLNSRLLETRLSKRGHQVKVTVDGQACADAFQRNPGAYDVILMDLQMPLVDGAGSTRLIRQFEKAHKPPFSKRAGTYGRIPIIAVSASLTEQSLDDYLNTGFDGWILKPIDFHRLEAILAAIQDQQIRELLLHGNETWDKGGWFRLRTDKVCTSSIASIPSIDETINPAI